MIVKFFTLCFVLTGLQGEKADYIFNDQADGWLKLNRNPTTWNDARIRCDTEDAVIATPINEKLRDAISQFVKRQNEGRNVTVSAIYTGVHADYGSGDYLSIEGVKLSQVPVEEYDMYSQNVYRNSESCIVWDQIGFRKLRRVQCEYIFPHVCYKRRANLEPITPPPAIIPIPETGLGAREPGTNPDIRSYAPTAGPQLYKEQQPYSTQNPQTNPQQSYWNQWSQTNQQMYTTLKPQTNPQSYLNQGPQTNPQIYPTQNQETNPQSYSNRGWQETNPQMNPQNPPDKMPRINYSNQPEQDPYSKCNFVENLIVPIVANSNDISKIINSIASKSVTILFADSVNITENGSMRHVNYLLKNYNTRSSQNVNEQHTQVIDVAHEMNENNKNESGQRAPQIPNITEVKPTNFNGYQPAKPSLSTSGFIWKAGGSFKLHMQPETFEAASLRCTSEGAVIASPLTNDLKNAINDFIKQNTALTTQFYIGVRANYSNGDFYSTEGVSLSMMPVYLNPGTFTDHESSDVCVTMKANNDIVTSVSCRDRNPYVCFKKSQPVRSCGKSDTAYEYKPQTQSCYKFHNDEKTWSEAYRVCAGEGGHLAVINSKEEAEALKILFSKYPKYIIKSVFTYSAYMGLRDWNDGKSWTTVKGIPSSGFIGWAPNEPMNYKCSTMSRQGLLHSYPCNLKLSFICEKDSEVLYNDEEQGNPNR